MQGINNSSLSSKIWIVSGNEFERKVPTKLLKDNKEYVEWGINNTVIKEKAYTDSIYCCNAIAVRDSEKVVFSHLLPDMSKLNVEKITKDLPKRISELGNGNLSGIIIGGRASNQDSLDAFLLLKDILNKLKIYPAIFWGQKHGHSRIFCSAKKKTFIINSQKKPYQPNNDVQTIRDIIDNFKFVDIPEQDILFINGVHINSRTLKRFLKR